MRDHVFIEHMPDHVFIDIDIGPPFLDPHLVGIPCSTIRRERAELPTEPHCTVAFYVGFNILDLDAAVSIVSDHPFDRAPTH